MSYLQKIIRVCTTFGLKYSIRFNHASQLRADIQRRPIDKVLIANRGEIACRVMRTAKKLGIRTVAVYSDADRDSMHVEMADEAYHIGPAPSAQSYLNATKILQVAKSSGSHAIHPGYGFLSENVEFCEKCAEEGVIFIGPPPSAIRDMGIKSTSKAIMADAGVPIIKGYHGEDQSIERLQAEARKIGFPLMIKAVRGGGGKGMRIAATEAEFLPQLESAKRESLKSFGDESVLLEQYIPEPRHVEVQVFADMHGNVVHLFERDCSVQRRHQKIVEEAPAPGLAESTRAELGAAAVRAARAVGYVGAGTVEFVLHRATHEFHFMEMNTRLQVEHPVTEMITGADLVEWQLRVAAGEPLPLRQAELRRAGHALECRVYAEEPGAGFLPRAGPLRALAQPAPESRVRLETGVREGDEVSVHYDPLVAKLVVWGRDRAEALAKARQKLAEYRVAGLETNVNFLLRLVGARAFAAGDVHTAFVEQHRDELFARRGDDELRATQAALAHLLAARATHADGAWKGVAVAADGWRPNYGAERRVRLGRPGGDEEVEVRVRRRGPDEFEVRVGAGARRAVRARLLGAGSAARLRTAVGARTSDAGVLALRDEVHVYDEDGQTAFRLPARARRPAHADDAGDVAAAPTPGVLEKVLVAEGEQVARGQPLFVLVAMKMEHVVRAPRDGRVARVSGARPGDALPRGAPLVTLRPRPATNPPASNPPATNPPATNPPAKNQPANEPKA